jgi:hypothetical protein
MIFNLLAAFGGGVFAAAIGGVPAFIMTGVFAIAGSIAAMCGNAAAAGILTGNIAFGSFFGPHISFAGAVAAAAYAKKKGALDNGADIVTALAGLNAPDVLLVGGVFGVIGFLFKNFVVDMLFGGGMSPRLVTDGPGFTVFCSALLVRAVFGGARFKTSDNFISSGNVLTNTVVIGACYSLVVAGVYVGAIATKAATPADFANTYHVLVFGMAAVGLTFAVAGLSFFGCHHIVIIAAEATVQSYATMNNLWASLIIGVIFGTVSAIIADIEGNTINCGTDSHIDNPACAIFIMTFVVNACFPNLPA